MHRSGLAKFGLKRVRRRADTDPMARTGSPDRFGTIGPAVDRKGR
jgi:hypothetical protein